MEIVYINIHTYTECHMYHENLKRVPCSAQVQTALLSYSEHHVARRAECFFPRCAASARWLQSAATSSDLQQSLSSAVSHSSCKGLQNACIVKAASGLDARSL